MNDDVVIRTSEDARRFCALEAVHGSLTVHGVSFDAPRLQRVEGSVTLLRGADANLPSCDAIGGGLNVLLSGSARINATRIGGGILATGSALVHLPRCQFVGTRGRTSVHATDASVVQLPAIRSVSGGVALTHRARLVAPGLATAHAQALLEAAKRAQELASRGEIAAEKVPGGVRLSRSQASAALHGGARRSVPGPGVLHARAVAALATDGMLALERCHDFLEQRVPYAPAGVLAAERGGELLRRLLDKRLWAPEKAAATKSLLERYVGAGYADVNARCGSPPDIDTPMPASSAVLVAALWNRSDAMATLIELGADCETATFGAEAASLWDVLEGKTSTGKITIGHPDASACRAAARAALMRREIAATIDDGATAPAHRLPDAPTPRRRHRAM